MKNRSLWVLLAAAAALPAVAQQAQQEPPQEPAQWLGPETPSPRVSVGYGQDEGSFRIGTLTAAVPVSGAGRLDLSLDRGRTGEGGRVTHYRAGITSDPLADEVVRLDGIVRNTPVARSREVQLQTRRYLQDWDLSFRLRGGRVSFASQQDDGSREQQRGQRVGTGLGVGYATGPACLRVQGIRYFYLWQDEEPRSANEGGLPFLSEVGGSSGGSLREPILTEREISTTATFFSGSWDWQLGAQRIVDTDGAAQNLALLGVGYQSRGGYSLGLNLDIPTDGEPVFAQLVLGFEL